MARTYFYSWYYFLIVFLASCVSVDYEVEPATSYEVYEAIDTLDLDNLIEPKKKSKQEIEAILSNIKSKLLPAAYRVCKEYSDNKNTSCGWKIELEENELFNAYASGEDKIVLFTGMFNELLNESEIAFVVAHEISHHIANHIHESSGNIFIGNLVGTAIGIASIEDDFSMSRQEKAEQVEQASKMGSSIGSLIYSRDQENEADLFAISILYLAGYDLSLSKGAVIRLVKKDPDKYSSNFFDTHPSGPERVFNYENNKESSLFKNISKLKIMNLAKYETSDRFNSEANQLKLIKQVSGMCVYKNNDNEVSIQRISGCKKFLEVIYE